MNSRQYFYKFGTLLYLIDDFYDSYAKKSKVKANLLWVIYAINDGNEHSQKEICENWGLSRSTVNTLITELKNKGYITLSQIKGESRELHVSLTEEGKEYADSLLKELYAIEAKVYKEFKGSDLISEMERMLKTLYKKEEEHR